jgi:hypothetical protein
VTLGTVAALAGWPAAATPLVPSREQARGWAARELADPAYARAQPGLLQRGVRWVLDRLAELAPDGAPTTRAGLVVLLLGVLVVAAAVLLRTGRVRGPDRSVRTASLFAGSATTAAGHRALADAAAARGDWAGAVRERFRAVVRTLEERTVLDERPGRTADEAARDAARLLPQLAADLGACARLFDEVAYGSRPARADHDARLRSLDQAVLAARPVWDAAAPAGSRP